MTPDYSITANDADITAAVRERFISMTIIDESGETTDSLSLSLSDARHEIELPSMGAELRVSIGYKGSGLQDMGLWLVDEISLAMPPAVMDIHAEGATFSPSAQKSDALKESRTRPWDQKTIGDIVETIAQETEFTARVASEFASIEINHIDQSHESNMHFLTRLARQYGAIAKPAGGFLLFTRRGAAETASGQALTPVTVTPADCKEWQITLAERDNYGTVEAYYHDYKKAKREKVSTNSGVSGTVKAIKKTYPTKAEAEAAIKAKKRDLQQSHDSGSLVLPGNPIIIAGTPITLESFRSGPAGNWFADTVTHELTKGGYQTTVGLKKTIE